jgi:hypothetical protein
MLKGAEKKHSKIFQKQQKQEFIEKRENQTYLVPINRQYPSLKYSNTQKHKKD